MRNRPWVLVITTIIFVGLLQSSAVALPLQITGYVRNLAGTSVSGATVSDGSPSGTVTTDAQGRYTIQESGFGTYSISASRAGAVGIPTSAVVTLSAAHPEATQDFQLRFVSTATVNSVNISTASSPATLTYTLTSGAPSPGSPGTGGTSCAYVTDSHTGVPSLMTYQGSSNQLQTWTWSTTLATNSTEGNFTLSGLVKDCGSGQQLDNGAPNINYIVDNRPPFILPQFTQPLDYGNTVFASQPLVAKVFDRGSGVDADTLKFRLTDQGTGSSTTVPAAAYSPSTGWAKTTSVSLIPGHYYSVEIEVNDRAGNRLTSAQDPAGAGGGFLSTTMTPASTLASVPPTQCTIASSPDPETGRKAVTCANVPLSLDAATVSVAGSNRIDDTGFVNHSVPLGSVRLSSTVGGIPVTQTVYGGTETRVAHMPFELPLVRLAGPSVYPVPMKVSSLGTVIATVPGDWTSATISMQPVSTTPSLISCADPSADTTGISCTSDPLQNRYVVYLSTPAAELATHAAAHAAAFDAVLSRIDEQANAYYAAVPQDTIDSLSALGIVRHVVRDSNQDIIDFWGSTCATKHTFVRLLIGQGINEKNVDLDTANDPTCEQTPNSITSVIDTTEFLQRVAECEPSNRSHYIHTTHDIEGFLGDTLFWFRSNFGETHNRCDMAKWWQTLGYMELWVEGGPSWWGTDPGTGADNYPEFTLVDWSQNRPKVAAKGHTGHVRGDPPSRYVCDIQDIITEVTGNANGRPTWTTQKVDSCEGIHSNTYIEWDQSRDGPWWGGEGEAKYGWGFPCERIPQDPTYCPNGTVGTAERTPWNVRP